MGVKINTQQIDLYNEEKLYDKNNNFVGFLRSAVYSPNFKKVVGIAMIEKNFWETSGKFKINIDGNFVSGEICDLPIVQINEKSKNLYTNKNSDAVGQR